MATKPCKVLTYDEGLPPIESHDPLITWSSEIKLNYKLKPYLFYHSLYGHNMWQDSGLLAWLVAIKSHECLITWSCEIT